MAVLRASLAAVIVALAAVPAAAEQLVISISRHQVMVNSSFDGTSIVLFGTVEPDARGGRPRIRSYDIVATVTGPLHNVVTRRKERVLGIWANVDSRSFINVPSYLTALSNRPFAQIANPDTLRQHRIGFDNIVLLQQIGSDFGDVARNDVFRANFLRLKMEQGLYYQRENGVTFLTPTVFRAGIQLPPIVQVGTYEVDVKLFSEGTLLARTNSAFEIIKVGFEQFVANAARDFGFLYGLATAILAVFTGWLASVVFRRN